MSTPRIARLRILRTVFVALCTLLVVGTGAASVAVAEPPTREPVEIPEEINPFTDTKGKNPCAFQVSLTVTTNNETETTFTRRSGVTTVHITGALKVTVTNTETGESIDLNIPGPIFFTVNADGSVTQKATGPALWVFDAGIATDLPRLAILHGQSESLFQGKKFTWISRTGTVEDLCAALAP
jgi:hypothetical protein